MPEGWGRRTSPKPVKWNLDKIKLFFPEKQWANILRGHLSPSQKLDQSEGVWELRNRYNRCTSQRHEKK